MECRERAGISRRPDRNARTAVEPKIAQGRSALADAARLAAARERVAAIERGEAVAGGAT
jgi:hypothetical protein